MMLCCLSDRMDDFDRPLKDYGSFVHVQPSEDDIAGMFQLLCWLLNVICK